MPRSKVTPALRSDALVAKAPRARLDVEERRAQLIDIGLTIFSARAYDDVSIDDIALAAGISKGLLYHYYASKRDLYVAALGSAARTLLDEHIDVHLCSSSRMRELYAANGFDAGKIRILRQEAPGNDLLWQRTGNQRRIVEPLARPLRVGFLGSVMPHKGVHILAAALQAFSPGEVECVVLGEQQRDYAQYLRTIDQKQRMHLHGAYAYAALPQLLGALDVVVVPSLVEEIGPMVVGEALAARCPVIGSRIGGIPDFVQHGTNGFLFSPGNVQELTECLRAFRRDPGLLGRMQRAIVAPRGLQAFGADLLSIYDDLASRAAGSSANAAMTMAPPAARTVARRPSLALA